MTAIDNEDAQQVPVYTKGYTRNARGQITATTSSRAAQEWVYTYDNLDRLIGADTHVQAQFPSRRMKPFGSKLRRLGDNSMDQTFTWSISGNLTCNSALGTCTYPAPTAARPHAPATVGAQSFAYDAAGNMTNGLEGRTIAYDGANRPVQVSWRSATTDYLYGPDGERVKKLTNAGTTTYLGDTELTPQGRTIVHPHPDVRLVDGTPSFLHRDHLTSVTVITDDAGATITTRDYTPHGDMEGHEWVDPLSQPESKAWIGERFDPETGLVYLHARYYDPKLGLFTQGDWWDPTEPGVGTNRYMYSFGDPVNLSDRNGHQARDPIMGRDEDGDNIPDALDFRDDRGLSIEGHPGPGLPGSVGIGAGGFRSLAGATAAAAQPRTERAKDIAKALGVNPSHVSPKDNTVGAGTIARDFDTARRAGFTHAGVKPESKVAFSKEDPATGTVTEFRGERGAKIGYDGPHPSVPGKLHDRNHISVTPPGKKTDKNRPANFGYEGAPHPARPDRKGAGQLGKGNVGSVDPDPDF